MRMHTGKKTSGCSVVAIGNWRHRSTGLQFGIGRCTAMLLKADFCKAIAKRAPQFVKFPETGWSHS